MLLLKLVVEAWCCNGGGIRFVVTRYWLNRNGNKLSATDRVKLTRIKAKQNTFKHYVQKSTRLKPISSLGLIPIFLESRHPTTCNRVGILSNCNYLPLTWPFRNKGECKKMTAHTNELFGSFIKNRNVLLKHFSLEVAAFVYLLETYRN